MNTVRNKKENLTKHIWTDTSVFIQVKYKSYGKYIYSQVEINFSSINVERNGLLEQTILDLPCPINPLIARTFASSLTFITKNSEIREKLSTNVSLLNYSDIWLIFQQIENYINSKNYQNPYALYIKAVQPYKGCTLSLSNGQFVRDIQYRTSFKYTTKSVKTLISERFDEGIEDVEMSYPLSLIINNNQKDLDDKSIKHLQSRLDRLSSACIEIIESHFNNSEKIKALKRKGLKTNYNTDRVNSIISNYAGLKDKIFRIPEKDKLQFYIFLIGKYKLYKHQKLEYKFSFRDLPEVDGFELNWTGLKPIDYLLCDYYLPRNVVFASLVILLIETGWNPSTLITLSKDRIDSSHPDQINITGIKSRTDQLQNHIIKNGSWPYRCLQLLLEHYDNIDKYALKNTDSIFLCRVNRTGLILNTFEAITHVERDIASLCIKTKIPNFKLKELRDQKANLEYMKSGKNPFVAMTLLGHKDLTVTDTYLNTNIIRVLNEANINEFMRRLGETILFTGGICNEQAVKNENDLLLFPVTPHSDKSIADDWINSIGRLKIKIGRAEIVHCAIQMKYYKESLPSLQNSNVKRFLHFHIPRILFCVAINKFIYQSEYRGVLREIEKDLMNG